LIPIFPLIAFVVIGFLGNKLFKKAEGGGYVAIAMAAVSCFISLMVAYEILSGGYPGELFKQSLLWINVPGQDLSFTFNVGIYIDTLTALMLIVVSFISTLVVIYSVGYMHEEGEKKRRYYAIISLFIGVMLGLVLASNYLQMFIFWELVGLCSYLLIGFWYTKPSAASAAKKAFLVTRVGDIMFMLGLFIFFVGFGGNLDYEHIFNYNFEDFVGGNSMLTLGTFFIFGGAVGKSAQFPLHDWLPDAMEGPTTVSALIHAATMVKAGVYLVARSYPVMVETPDTMLIVAIVGGITALMAATMALNNPNIKRVLAYSTISQLGYMFLALGTGGYFFALTQEANAGYTSGMFHLMNHAFFKALLFLSAGAVIHAVHTEDMRLMGGLSKKLKITSLVMLIGCISIAGIPPLSGFWSKDEILASVWETGAENPIFYLLYIMGILTAFMTAFYMFRQYFLTFTGEPRNHEKFHHAHESPKTMTIPLIVLAALAIVAGGFKLSPHTPTWFEKVNTVPTLAAYAPAAENAALERAAAEAHGEAAAAGGEHGAEAAEGEHGGGHHDPVVMRAHTLGMILSILLAGGGIALAFAFYFRGLTHVPALLKARLKPIHSFLWNKWYFDELYMATLFRGSHLAAKASWLFDRFVVDFVVNLAGWSGRLAAWLIGLVDKYVVDGTVNGLGWICQGLGAGFAQLQSGQLRSYLLTLIVGFMVVAATLAAILLGAV